ncbi:sugar transferase [Sphingomonas zeae]|jgi:lipopolysaccharide/colanic/teichoic acid biosynthesis glycosyltransferase
MIVSPSPLSHPELLQTADKVLAFLLLILLSPLMLIIATLIALESRGGSAIYGHRRYGKDGRTFLCYKFRSMALDADARLARLLSSDPAARAEWARDHKLRHDPRVTRIGRFIRRTSLDELPQLFNILRGEMSLVGPRPIVAAEVRRYGRRFVDYCSVRPGMTGIWQISGRNDVGYRRRIAMDCLMARRMSPRLYAEVLIGTARSVMMRKGAY